MTGYILWHHLFYTIFYFCFYDAYNFIKKKKKRLRIYLLILKAGVVKVYSLFHCAEFVLQEYWDWKRMYCLLSSTTTNKDFLQWCNITENGKTILSFRKSVQHKNTRSSWHFHANDNMTDGKWKVIDLIVTSKKLAELIILVYKNDRL